MSQDEALKDNTLVLWEWRQGNCLYRVTFVDGQPKFEVKMHGDWYMAKQTPEGRVLLNAFVAAFVGGLRFQLDRSKAEVDLALAYNDEKRAGHWRKVVKRIEGEIGRLPAPWNALERRNTNVGKV